MMRSSGILAQISTIFNREKKQEMGKKMELVSHFSGQVNVWSVTEKNVHGVCLLYFFQGSDVTRGKKMQFS